jgi:DNA-3-methyladenine glycosylase II
LKQARLAFRLALPAAYRAADFLAFHRRDAAALAERVDGNAVQKGMVWAGRPACIGVRFGARHAAVELVVDGVDSVADADAARRMARRMLGLQQAVDDFEAPYRGHPELGPLIAANPGLRVPLLATPFEAIVWAVTGQQISVAAATAVRRRLIEAAGIRHSDGLLCHPDPARLARMGDAQLRAAGLSQAKAATVTLLSHGAADGTLPFEAWADAPPVAEIRARLATIRGIGQWTIEYALLRGFGHLDGSLHGDVAVRRKLQLLLGREEKISATETGRWLAQFTPWRALVAAHLWAWHP